MTGAGEIAERRTGGASSSAPLLAQFETLRREHDALSNELLRYYEQLALVFDLTENIAPLQDPEVIENALLSRLGSALHASAVFYDDAITCRAVPLAIKAGSPVLAGPSSVRECLRAEIALARTAGRSQVVGHGSRRLSPLCSHAALLGVLERPRGKAAVVIVLRDQSEPAFDSGDVMALEAVLGYGGHILNNVVMVQDLQQTAVETIHALANAIDAKDAYTRGHSARVGGFATMLGKTLGLSSTELTVLEWSGMLHDVGKIGISDQILNKPGRLSDAERDIIQRHPRMSYDVLRPVARLGPVLDAVLYHHENWDGSGYPEGRRAHGIPFTARVIRVADSFDALTSSRAYRSGYPYEAALRIIQHESGRAFDPELANAFLDMLADFRRTHPAEFAKCFEHVEGCGGAQVHAKLEAVPQ